MPLQQYLTDELFVTKKLTVSVMNVIKVLAKVEEANQLGRQLPPEAFYNELIRSVVTAPQAPLRPKSTSRVHWLSTCLCHLKHALVPV